MPLFNWSKDRDEAEETNRPRTKKVIHQARVAPTGAKAAPAKTTQQPIPEPLVQEALETVQPPPLDLFPGEAPPKEQAGVAERFKQLTKAEDRGSGVKLPRKYLIRTALWDLASVVSLVINAILVGVIVILASRLNTLQNTLNGLLGGLYDNFVRMDKSYITTTILVEDMPIPLDFTLPVVQDNTNVTLTRDVTISNAYVVIDTALIDINAPATVTLPSGTTLPVALSMEVPVQTTVTMDLQVPINIELAQANSSDPGVANLHTAFLGLQDTIGPLYCLLQPGAVDYLAQPLCDPNGNYLTRKPPTP